MEVLQKISGFSVHSKPDKQPPSSFVKLLIDAEAYEEHGSVLMKEQ